MTDPGLTVPVTVPPGWVGIPPEQVYSELRANTTAVLSLQSEVSGLRDDLKALTDLDNRVKALELRLAGWLLPVGGLGGLIGLGNTILVHFH
jgi:hypothetical protein